MELRHLRYFIGMVEAGSLMKASERLHVAQPALSVHLSNLEVDLGVKLFKRSNRGIELTEDGAQFYERAVAMVRYHDESLNSFRMRKDTPSGLVTIGLPSTLPSMIGPALYKHCRDILPDVNLYIADSSTAVLHEWLFEDKLDLAVLFSFPEKTGFEVSPLFEDEFCLVGLPSANFGATDIEFEEIFDLPLVLPCRSTSWRKILEDATRRFGRQLKAIIETESYSALRSMALSGECYAVLPKLSVYEDIDQGRLVARRITNPDLRGTYAVAMKSSRAASRAVREIRNLLITACGVVTAEMNVSSKSATNRDFLRISPSSLFPIRDHAGRGQLVQLAS